MHSKLSKKIIIACLIWVLIPLLFLGIRFYRVSTGLLNDQLMQVNLEHVQHIDSYYLSHVNDNLEFFLELWIDKPELLSISTSPMSEKTLRNEWENALLGYPEIQSIYFSSPKGDFFSSPVFAIPADFYAPERHWYKKAVETDQTVWTSPYIDALTGNSVFTVAKRIVTGSGEIAGVLAIDVTLKEMTTLLELTRIGDAGRLIVTDLEGNVIVSPEPDLLNQNILDRDWAKNLFESDSGSYKFNVDEPLVISFTTNQETGWKVVGVIPEEELLEEIAPYRSLYTRVILFVTVWAIVGIGGFIAYIYQKLVKRIEQLQGKMKLAENGEFSQIEIVSQKKPDEIEMLFESFNHMITGQKDLLIEISESSNRLNHTSKMTLDISKAYKDSAHEQASEMAGFNEGVERLNAFIQKITEEMAEISKHIRFLSTSMNEMGDSSVDVANSAVSTSEAIADVLRSLEMLDYEIQKINNKVIELKTLGMNSVKSVQLGKESLQSTSAEMDIIQKNFGELIETIQGLESYAEEIGDILGIIEDLTEQTGILSLNASIEATRAGEHGKGFVAVASAIGRLSEKSKLSTRDIEKIITRIQESIKEATLQTDLNQSQVEKGVQQTKISLNAFNEIEKSVLSTATAIDEIAEATEKQTEVSDAILSASTRVNDLTMLVSASSEEQSATVEELVVAVQSIDLKANSIAEETRNQAENSNQLAMVSEALNLMTLEIFNASKEIECVAEELTNESDHLTTSISSFNLEDQ